MNARPFLYSIGECTYICVYVCTYVCIYCVYTVCISIYMCIYCVYCVYVYIYIHIHTHIYIHTHTCIYIGIRDITSQVTLKRNDFTTFDDHNATFDEMRICHSCQHFCIFTAIACECSNSRCVYYEYCGFVYVCVGVGGGYLVFYNLFLDYIYAYDTNLLYS